MSTNQNPRDRAVERLAAVLLNAAKSGHIHGSVEPRLVAEAYADDWRPVVGLMRMMLSDLGAVFVEGEVVAECKRAAFAQSERCECYADDGGALVSCEWCLSRLALADHVMGQVE